MTTVIFLPLSFRADTSHLLNEGTVNHFLTMTDCCGMLSSVHTGDRRDLCASVLFFVPLLREVHFCYSFTCISLTVDMVRLAENQKEMLSLLSYRLEFA